MTTKKKSLQQTSLFACRDPGVDTVDNRHSCDAWYGKYLQSELAAFTARSNAEVRAKEVMRKDCTMLWAALSAQRTRVTKQKISEDETILLKKYAAKKSTHNALLERLFEVVRNTASMVRRLTKASEKTQNSLQIHGVTVEDGDLNGISKTFEKSLLVICDLSAKLKDKNSFVMAGSLENVQEDLEQTMEAYIECDALVRKLRDESVMVASINFSTRGKYIWLLSF